MNDFFNRAKLDAAVLGNHAFDISYEYLSSYLKKRNSVTLISGVELSGNESILPNQKSSEIFDLSGIKVGVFGLISSETKHATSAFKSGKFPDYTFKNTEE